MDRRTFLKTAAVATSICGMTSVSGTEGGQVVITIDPSIRREAASQMIEELKSRGIKAIVISGMCEVYVPDQRPTFYSPKVVGARPLRVIADGIELSNVLWCDTFLGLVCQIEASGSRIVRQFDSVRVEEIRTI